MFSLMTSRNFEGLNLDDFRVDELCDRLHLYGVQEAYSKIEMPVLHFHEIIFWYMEFVRDKSV